MTHYSKCQAIYFDLYMMLSKNITSSEYIFKWFETQNCDDYRDFYNLRMDMIKDTTLRTSRRVMEYKPLDERDKIDISVSVKKGKEKDRCLFDFLWLQKIYTPKNPGFHNTNHWLNQDNKQELVPFHEFVDAFFIFRSSADVLGKVLGCVRKCVTI